MAKGKRKGGKYENLMLKMLAEEFKSIGIQQDDCFRTKNSGGTKDQAGDIGLSPRFAKIFPVLIECKFYKTVKYKLGKAVNKQSNSFHLYGWWEQVRREQKQHKDRCGILVFRQNNCPDLVCLKIEHFQVLTGKMPQWEMFSWSMCTSWQKESLIIVPFKELTVLVIEKAKARIMQRKLIKESKRKTNARNK
jgi:hypothetical protein